MLISKHARVFFLIFSYLSWPWVSSQGFTNENFKNGNQKDILQFRGEEPSQVQSQMMVFNPTQNQIKIPQFSSPTDEGHNKLEETSRCFKFEDLPFMKLITEPNYFSKFVHPAQIHQNYQLKLANKSKFGGLARFFSQHPTIVCPPNKLHEDGIGSISKRVSESGTDISLNSGTPYLTKLQKLMSNILQTGKDAQEASPTGAVFLQYKKRFKDPRLFTNQQEAVLRTLG